jgi:hypothetical protein
LIGCRQESQTDYETPQYSEDISVSEFNGQVLVDVLNVYKTYSLDAQVLVEIYKGSIYDIQESKQVEDSIWLKIELESNQFGWVMSDYIDTTSAPPFEYEKGICPDLKVPSHILKGDDLDIRKIKEGYEDYLIYVNGEFIGNIYPIKEHGIYEVYGIHKDNPNQRTLTYQVETVKDFIYGLIYEDYSSDSNVVGYISWKYDLEKSLKDVYMTYDNGIQMWYKVDYMGVEGYVLEKQGNPIRDLNKIHVVCENEIKLVESDYLSPYYDLFYDRYFRIYGTRQYIINPQNGAVLETKPYAYFLDEEKVVLEYDEIYMYENQNNDWKQTEDFNLRIIDLEKGNFEVLFDYKDASIGIYTSYYDTNKNSDIYFEISRVSEEPWSFVDDRPMKEIYKLSKENLQWTFERVEGIDENNPKPVFQVFESYHDLSTSLGTYTIEDCEAVEFINVYDIIDNAYALWFEVTLNNGSKGYAYRPLRQEEKDLPILDESISLVLANGGIHEINLYEDNWYRSVNLVSGLEKLNTYLLSYAYEGEVKMMLSKDDGLGEIQTTAEYYTTPDQNYLLEKTYSYGGYGYGREDILTIYDVSSGKKDHMQRFEHAGYWIRSLNVVSDTCITYFKMNDNKKMPVILKWVNGKWQVIDNGMN